MEVPELEQWDVSLSALSQDTPAVSIATRGCAMKDEHFSGRSLCTLFHPSCTPAPRYAHFLSSAVVSVICMTPCNLGLCITLCMSVGLACKSLLAFPFSN